MLDAYFSKRHNLGTKSYGFIYEYIPESARIGLYQILVNYFENGFINANQLYLNVRHALHIPKEYTYGKVVNLPEDARKAIGNLIMECDWWQFYDICEVVPRSVNPRYSNMLKDFYEKANILFKTEKLGFEITNDGIVEQVDASFTDVTIIKARYLLKDPEFKEANEHFERALKEIYADNNLDGEKCINDALLAIESIARGINNSDKNMSSFNDVIDNMTEKGTLSKPLDKVIRNIYALMGDQQRTTYGIDEAEFVLATSAAIITYLINKNYQSKPAQGPDEPHISTNHLITIQS